MKKRIVSDGYFLVLFGCKLAAQHTRGLCTFRTTQTRLLSASFAVCQYHHL